MPGALRERRSLLVEVPHGSRLYEATIVLREAVLRRPLGLGFERAELDAEASSHHLAVIEAVGETELPASAGASASAGVIDGEVVGCLVLRPLGAAAGSVQMRQVAVAPALQRRGIGAALVAFAERFAWERGYREIAVHAREAVAPFYDRLGYDRTGARFIEVTLPHLGFRKRRPE